MSDTSTERQRSSTVWNYFIEKLYTYRRVLEHSLMFPWESNPLLTVRILFDSVVNLSSVRFAFGQANQTVNDGVAHSKI